MDLEFTGMVVQKLPLVKLSADYQYKEIIVKIDTTQYYSVRVLKKGFSDLKKVKVGQHVLVKCHTFSQRKYVQSTDKTLYSILLIADKISLYDRFQKQDIGAFETTQHWDTGVFSK